MSHDVNQTSAATAAAPNAQRQTPNEEEEKTDQSLTKRLGQACSWTYRASMTILIMFLFKLYAFFSSCFMTLPVLLPINKHASKDNKIGGPIVPYFLEMKIKFWCFLHIVFNFQVSVFKCPYVFFNFLNVILT